MVLPTRAMSAARRARKVVVPPPDGLKFAVPKLKQPLPQHKNLFDLINTRPDQGVGMRVSRSIWRRYGEEQCNWVITKVKLAPDLRHGRAYGIFTWKGVSDGRELRIRNSLKPYWFVVGQAPDLPIDYGAKTLTRSAEQLYAAGKLAFLLPPSAQTLRK